MEWIYLVNISRIISLRSLILNINELYAITNLHVFVPEYLSLFIPKQCIFL